MEDCGECNYCEKDFSPVGGPSESVEVNINGTTVINYPDGVDSFRDTLAYAGFGSPDNQHPRYGWQSWDEVVEPQEEE